jgi:SAM-dependent methyltransferase
LLALLACPKCGKPLRPSANGVSCDAHGLFPRRGRMISFLDEAGSAFDDHWQQAGDVQRPRAKMAAAARFLSLLEELRGSEGAVPKVLDVGCGDGVHVERLLASGRPFAIAGLDYSSRALRNAMQVKGDWLPVHADAQHLPFLDDSFDATISFGVQAYLDDPAQGMSEMVRVTGPGGLIGLWYAPRRSGVSGALFAAARRIVPRLPGWVQRRVADMMVPFLGLMPTASSLSLRTGSWRECREVILVNIAPKRIAFPTMQEIISGLTRLGCEMVAKEGAIEGEYWARKKPR